MTVTLKLGETKTVSLSPNLTLPAGVQPNWNRISGTCDVSVASDGLSAVLTASGSDTGRTVFAVSATPGRETIGFILGIEVIPNETSELNPTVE